MANKKPRNQWESSLLAAALAIAGSMFMLDKLGSLIHKSILSVATIVHTAPALLIVMGVSLLLADGTMARPASEDHAKAARYE